MTTPTPREDSKREGCECRGVRTYLDGVCLNCGKPHYERPSHQPTPESEEEIIGGQFENWLWDYLRQFTTDPDIHYKAWVDIGRNALSQWREEAGLINEGLDRHFATPESVSWEDRFDEKFQHRIHCKMTNICGCGLDDIKSFIRQERQNTLALYKKELGERLYELEKEIEVREGIIGSHQDGQSWMRYEVFKRLADIVKGKENETLAV